MIIDENRYQLCFYDNNDNIHSGNIIDEDEEYYYIAPYKTIHKIKKEDVSLDVRPLLKENLIHRLENNIRISKNRRKELVAELLVEIREESPEYFI